MLSGLWAVDLVTAIRGGQAERLVLEPRDNLHGVLLDQAAAAAGPAVEPAGALGPMDWDVVSALVNLGA